MELKEFACPNCHAPLTPIEGARYMFCDYCGTKIVIDDIEYYREDSKTERERIRADKEIQKSSVEKGTEVELKRIQHKETVFVFVFFGAIALLCLLLFVILGTMGLLE